MDVCRVWMRYPTVDVQGHEPLKQVDDRVWEGQAVVVAGGNMLARMLASTARDMLILKECQNRCNNRHCCM